MVLASVYSLISFSSLDLVLQISDSPECGSGELRCGLCRLGELWVLGQRLDVVQLHRPAPHQYGSAINP